MPRAAEFARRFAEDRTSAELSTLVDEIQLELDRPTQEIRAILDNPQPEEVCRQYLRAFVATIRMIVRSDTA